MRKVGVIALVLAGIWVLTQALNFLGGLLTFLLADTPGNGAPRAVVILVSLLPAVSALALGVVLIARREALAERWFEDGGPELRLTGASLLRAGLLIIGVGMVAQAVPTLFEALTWPFVYAGQDPSGNIRAWVLEVLPQVAVAVAGVVVGLVLIAASRSLSRRLWFGRTAAEAEAPVPARCPSCGAAFDLADYAGGLVPPTCEACGESLDVAGNLTTGST